MARVCLPTALAVIVLVPVADHVYAQPPEEAEDDVVDIRLEPTSLRVGDRVSLVVEVVLGPGIDARLALTPSTEGSTLEVVRGRLLSSEARIERDEAGRTHLFFALPVIAHAPGAAVLRVDLDALVCAGTCRHVERSERFAIEVAPGSGARASRP